MFDINKLEIMDIVFADEAHERFFYEKVRELPNSRRDSEEIAMYILLVSVTRQGQLFQILWIKELFR